MRLSAGARYARLAYGFALVAGLMMLPVTADAKIPGKTHCYFGICHRVKTLPEMQKLVGSRVVVNASFYDDCRVDRFNPCSLTSSGEVFKPHRPDNAASPIYPDGTKLLLWNPRTNAAAVVRVNSAGPYHGKRTLDVSRATAEKLGFKRAGVAQLHVQVLYAPTPAESRYKRHRTYDPVPGPIGKYSTFELASLDTQRLMPTRPAVMIAAAPQPRFRLSSLPLSNAKAINAGGRDTTIAVMASAAGAAGPSLLMSANAAWLNAVPHNLLPDGVMTERRGSQRRGPTKSGRSAVLATNRI